LLINREHLRELIPVIASQHKFRPAIVEKDYYLTVILNNINSLLTDKIVFKGGTLLNKIHLNYHRLSEDLDFTYRGACDLGTRSQRSRAIKPIRDRMPQFLKALGLKSSNPQGEGFNNSTQYVFSIQYASDITGRDENVKLEISLRQFPLEEPVRCKIKHFYQDPFSGEDLIPTRSIWSLSYTEAVAEKLKAAIARKDVAVRDYYDIWHISKAGFDFFDDNFIRLFKTKLANDGYQGDFHWNFGLDAESVELLNRQINTDLAPVVRARDQFDMVLVFNKFNNIFANIKYA
jgi:predicted nucleotidyltransferase component of viral defense system